MRRIIVLRLVGAVPLVFLVSVLVFGLVHLMPGSASERILGDGATEEAVAALDAELGLDRPLLVQYGAWAADAVRGDFGRSLIDKRAVSTTLAERVPVTMSVAFGGLVVSLAVGLLAGTAAALRQGGWLDRTVSLGTATGLAVPNFWVAFVMAYWLGVRWGWFPAVGYTPFTEHPVEWAHGLVLPALALGAGSGAVIARQMRSGLLDVLERPFIVTARAKGLSPARVVMVHAIKNAMIPVVTVIGFQVSLMIGGAFVVEQVFGIPGMGTTTVKAVLDRDLPLVQGTVMITALVVIAVNLMVDISYAYFDPRVRVQ